MWTEKHTFWDANKFLIHKLRWIRIVIWWMSNLVFSWSLFLFSMWFPPGVYTARMSFVYLFILRLYSRRPWTVVYDLNPNNLRKKVFSPVPRRRRRPLNVLFTMQQQRWRMTKQQQKYRKVADADVEEIWSTRSTSCTRVWWRLSFDLLWYQFNLNIHIATNVLV